MSLSNKKCNCLCLESDDSLSFFTRTFKQHKSGKLRPLSKFITYLYAISGQLHYYQQYRVLLS